MCEFYQALLWTLFVQGPDDIKFISEQTVQYTARGLLK